MTKLEFWVKWKHRNLQQEMFADLGSIIEEATFTLKEVLDNISGICVNYDGYTTAEGLRGLIDDIKEMADKALAKEEKK
jgi:hypothetical protein